MSSGLTRAVVFSGISMGLAFVAGFTIKQMYKMEKLQSSIDNYVARTGNGDIACTFAGAKVSFSGKKLTDIDPVVRPSVETGFKTGDCRAELAKPSHG